MLSLRLRYGGIGLLGQDIRKLLKTLTFNGSIGFWLIDQFYVVKVAIVKLVIFFFFLFFFLNVRYDSRRSVWSHGALDPMVD